MVDRIARARAVLAAVADPELPMLSIVDLGMARGIEIVGGTLEVALAPTYTACPATAAIALDAEAALLRAGLGPARVRTVLAPAWTTDWITDEGRRKLAAAGIAPPPATSGRGALVGMPAPACPRCGSAETETVSAFGATACKALMRCLGCREPFEAFKCH